MKEQWIGGGPPRRLRRNEIPRYLKSVEEGMDYLINRIWTSGNLWLGKGKAGSLTHTVHQN